MENHVFHSLQRANIPLDHWQSDLYALVTEQSTKILDFHKPVDVRTFISQKDGKEWYSIPFQYLPYWEDKTPQENITSPLDQ